MTTEIKMSNEAHSTTFRRETAPANIASIEGATLTLSPVGPSTRSSFSLCRNIQAAPSTMSSTTQATAPATTRPTFAESVVRRVKALNRLGQKSATQPARAPNPQVPYQPTLAISPEGPQPVHPPTLSPASRTPSPRTAFLNKKFDNMPEITLGAPALSRPEARQVYMGRSFYNSELPTPPSTQPVLSFIRGITPQGPSLTPDESSS